MDAPKKPNRKNLIAIRISPQLQERLDFYASGKDKPRSQAINELIELGLEYLAVEKSSASDQNSRDIFYGFVNEVARRLNMNPDDLLVRATLAYETLAKDEEFRQKYQGLFPKE